MSEPRPARVRVTGPPRHGSRPRRPGLDQESPLGRVYVASLVREQGRLAIGVLALLLVTVGALPLLFVLAPGLAATDVLGVPLAWLVLGVLVYPFLAVLAWVYVRRAERNERDFADLLTPDRPDPGPPGRPAHREEP